MAVGRRTWVFADGDMPPHPEGAGQPRAHEALMVKSNVPVVAFFGRLDRRRDMAHYAVALHAQRGDTPLCQGSCRVYGAQAEAQGRFPPYALT